MIRLEDWDTWPRTELLALGKMVREYPAFPKGANVSFWSPAGGDRFKVVTFERGVEDLTLACGTGAGCTAAALRLSGQCEAETILLDFPGGELQVSVMLDGGAVTDIYLTGGAHWVAEGELFTDVM